MTPRGLAQGQLLAHTRAGVGPTPAGGPEHAVRGFGGGGGQRCPARRCQTPLDAPPLREENNKGAGSWTSKPPSLSYHMAQARTPLCTTAPGMTRTLCGDRQGSRKSGT